MACARCEELVEEVAYLRSELGLALRADDVKRVQAAFGISPSSARLLLALHAAKGKTRTRAQILDAIPPKSDDEDRSFQLISVYVSRLRQALGKDAIETVWGEGFRLSPAGLAKVSAALAEQVAA